MMIPTALYGLYNGIPTTATNRMILTLITQLKASVGHNIVTGEPDEEKRPCAENIWSISGPEPPQQRRGCVCPVINLEKNDDV